MNSFSWFVFRLSQNRWYGIVFLIGSFLLWIVFKTFYPHPNIIFDSYHYVAAAASGAAVNTWPIGYSLFLRLVGFFTHGGNGLLLIQYLLLQVSLLFFFFTIRYFFSFSTFASHLLFAFLLLNPIYLYTSNMVLSDTLFTALSVCWLAQLLWIIFRPHTYMIVTHALLLLVTFTVRYNALYYPVVAAVAFLFSRQRWTFIAAGITLQTALVGGFVIFTTQQVQRTYGVRQFSPFGGWKLASNALYMYEHVYQQAADPVPVAYQRLDTQVRKYFNRPHEKNDLLVPDPTWGSYYMFMAPSPLIRYMHKIYGPDDYPLQFTHFANVAPLYQQYGGYLIRRHPLPFFRHFVWPNMQRYIHPPQEALIDSVNPFHIRRDVMSAATIQWFQLQHNIRVPRPYIRVRSALFGIYPAFSGMVHYLFILSALSLLLLNGYRHLALPQQKALLAAGLLWLCDFGFSVLSAGVVLRYQLFIMTAEFSFLLLFMEAAFRKQPASSSESVKPLKAEQPVMSATV